MTFKNWSKVKPSWSASSGSIPILLNRKAPAWLGNFKGSSSGSQNRLKRQNSLNKIRRSITAFSSSQKWVYSCLMKSHTTSSICNAEKRKLIKSPNKQRNLCWNQECVNRWISVRKNCKASEWFCDKPLRGVKKSKCVYSVTLSTIEQSELWFFKICSSLRSCKKYNGLFSSKSLGCPNVTFLYFWTFWGLFWPK